MKIKIDSHDLQIGMYVSELDRPWIESPFIFQGFPIRTPEEIEQLRGVCRYVYIDTDKTPINIKNKISGYSQNNKRKNKDKRRNGAFSQFTDTVTFKTTERETSDFKEELVKARIARDKTRGYIDKVLDDVRMGNSIDTKSAKMLVSELADSVIRNPDASVWLTSLKNRDEYTAIHCVNVCILSITFARALGLSRQALNEVGLGALLHDIGKLKTPLEILNKPGKLTDEEFKIMKTHPVAGYELLKNDKTLTKDTLDIVRSHHERVSGKGYPRGLIADNINYYTRIVAITDVYDAITSDRVYHDGMTPHEALKKMYDWMPGNFDEELIQAFIRTIGIYPIGSVVEFESGHIGIVVKLNEDQKLKPVVILIMNRNKEFYPQRKLINLASPVWTQDKRVPAIKRIVDPKEYDIDIHIIINEESH